MKYRTLTKDEVKNTYDYDMKRDFPPDELRPLKSIFELIDAGEYIPFGAFDCDGKLIGSCMLWTDARGEALVDYLYTHPSVRGRGAGSALFKAAVEASGCTRFFVEAEAPSESDSKDSFTRRRLGFYKRLGFEYLGFKSCIYGVTYEILQYEKTEQNEINPLNAYRNFYETYLPNEIYRRHVRIPLCVKAKNTL